MQARKTNKLPCRNLPPGCKGSEAQVEPQKWEKAPRFTESQSPKGLICAEPRFQMSSLGHWTRHESSSGPIFAASLADGGAFGLAAWDGVFYGFLLVLVTHVRPKCCHGCRFGFVLRHLMPGWVRQSSREPKCDLGWDSERHLKWWQFRTGLTDSCSHIVLDSHILQWYDIANI